MDTKTLSPSNSGRRRINTNSDCTTSPEFEFWMVRNPSFPQPNILSADELFVDGVLLPLHQSTHNKPDPPDKTPLPDPAARGPHSTASITDIAATTTLSSSKRWKDIFRKSDKKNAEEEGKKKERKGGSGGATTSAELNINIWPFTRSRSAGNVGTRPKLFPGAPASRRVNSAPCSRSNSAGESKCRKWPSSPGRAGIHLGRSSPVWQVRRGGSTSPKNTESMPLNPEKGSKRKNPTILRSKLASSSGGGGGSGGAKGKVLNLNVPMCIGYKQHLSCRREENSVIGSCNIRGSIRNGGDVNGNGTNGNVGSKLFNLRSIFTKKSLVTSH